MSTVSDLTAAAQAADPACVGCALIGAQPAQPGWVVAERADGLRVRVDGVPPDSPAVAAVLVLDLSEAAARARALNATRTAALTGLLTRGDEIGLAVRQTVAALTYLINERLQHFNAQVAALGGVSYPEPVRVLQSEVLGYLMENPTAGDPAPVPPLSPGVG